MIAPDQEPTVRLRRTLTLPLLTLYGVGVTVGAGIYVLTGKVIGVAGVFAPVSFLLAALLAGLSALSFAELAVRMPRAAGEALYVQKGLGRRFWHSWWGWRWWPLAPFRPRRSFAALPVMPACWSICRHCSWLCSL